MGCTFVFILDQNKLTHDSSNIKENPPIINKEKKKTSVFQKQELQAITQFIKYKRSMIQVFRVLGTLDVTD